MYFLVNASPPKLLEVETSNVVPEKVTWMFLFLFVKRLHYEHYISVEGTGKHSV